MRAVKVVPDEIFQPAEGRALICGSKVYETNEDRRVLYADPIGVDMLAGPGVDYVGDLADPSMFKPGFFAHVDCCSVLEHCSNPWAVAQNLARVLRPGGTILVSVPWMWRYHGYPCDYFRFTPDGVRVIFPSVEFTFMGILSEGKWYKGRKAPRVRDKTVPPLFYRCEVVGWGVKKS